MVLLDYQSNGTSTVLVDYTIANIMYPKYERDLYRLVDYLVFVRLPEETGHYRLVDFNCLDHIVRLLEKMKQESGLIALFC